MDSPLVDGVLEIGTEVYGADGGELGKVVAVHANHVVVEKGFFFPSNTFIPFEAIATVDGNRAYLNVTKDEALNRGWDIEPVPDDAPATRRSEDWDASGTAGFAAAKERLPSDLSTPAAADAAAGAAAAAGLTDHLGESPTTPGLAGDLADRYPGNKD